MDIKLRPIEPQDLDLLYQYENDPDNWLISNTSTPFSKQTLKKYLASIHDIYADKQLRMVIINKNFRAVGLLDFFDYDDKNRRVGLGIVIDKEFRAQGIGKKAIKEAVKYGFDVLYLHQIYCNIMASNSKSINLFESLGFVRCADKKDWIQTPQGWENELMYQLINPNK